MTCVGGEKTWPSWKWKCHTWNYSSFLRAFSTSLAHQRRRLSIANWRHLSELLLHEKSENYRISHLSLFDKETIVYKNRVFVFHFFSLLLDFSLYWLAEWSTFLFYRMLRLQFFRLENEWKTRLFLRRSKMSRIPFSSYLCVLGNNHQNLKILSTKWPIQNLFLKEFFSF